jgi:ketosteroid isomerase-like protein
MKLTRRDLAAAGALAISAAALIRPAAADTADEKAVTDAIDAFRKAMIAQDKPTLEKLAADQISYGHSSGMVQNKAEMVNGYMSRKATVKSIEYPELKIAIVGNNAVARHLYVQESELDGKSTNVKIGMLQVWQKEPDGWKLLARQGYKLA